MRLAMPSGLKSSMSSSFSPEPMNLMGFWTTVRMLSAAAGVAVELGEDDAVEVEALVELAGGVDGVLAGHGVYDEERLLGLDAFLYGLDFLHHLLVDGQAAGGVDDDQVEVVGACVLDAAARDGHGVLAVGLAVDGHPDLLAEDLELVDGGRAVDVAGHQQGLAALGGLEAEGELAGEGGLAGSLQAGHEYHGRVALDVEGCLLAAHQVDELAAHDAQHQLLRLEGVDDVLAHGLGLHRVGELLGHFVVDVGVKQGAAHVLERLGDVDLGDAALALEYLE